MKYLKAFEDHEEYTKELTERKSVSLCKEEKHVHYKNKKRINGILTFVAQEPNSTIRLNQTGTSYATPSLSYSLDSGKTWNEYTYEISNQGYNGLLITLEKNGDSVKFKGNNNKISYGTNNYSRFTMSGKISSYGDVTSMLNEQGYECSLQDYCFYGLFSGCTSLTEAPEIPTRNVGTNALNSMFFGCSSLTSPPITIGEDSSSTIGVYGCYSMFNGCLSLEECSVLPSNSINDYCYNSMFKNCQSIKEAAELPSTTLGIYCYQYMFQNCYSLTKIHDLPATIAKNHCYHYMFGNCISLEDASISISATTLDDNCFHEMFRGCESLKYAPPVLPSETAVQYCYRYMFSGCTSLEVAPEIRIKTFKSDSFRASLSYMFYNCSSLRYIKAMFLTAPNSNDTPSWVYGVASAGTFVKNSSAFWNVTGVHGIPNGWTVETASS